MIRFIDEAEIKEQTVLLRVDFNVSLHPDHTISDDARIKQSLPTINHLLKNKNKLLLLSHLGRPDGKEQRFSLAPVAKKLQTLLPHTIVTLISNYYPHTSLPTQTDRELLLFENIRFYEEEKKNDAAFAKHLASLADAYVNDAFAVCHRKDASIVTIPSLLPSFGGLLLKKELRMLSKLTHNPAKPFVALLGGSKISTKLSLLSKLITIADYLLLGGGLAHNFLRAKGFEVGKSIIEADQVALATDLLTHAVSQQTQIILPTDLMVQAKNNSITVKPLSDMTGSDTIYDIGPHTQAVFAEYLHMARTIVWNGPVGYFEKAAFRRGTDAMYRVIANNHQAFSVVGGGETLAALKNKAHLSSISHLSTGGGAMLAFLENGTLPGIDALKKAYG